MKYRRLPVAILLGWVAIAGLFMAWHDTATTDEMIHVSSGYLAMTRGEFRFDPEHPYFFKYFSAAPLLALRPNLPPDDQLLWNASRGTFYDSWKEAREWSDQWLYKSGNDAQLMTFLARIPAVLSLLLLCYFVYRFGSTWYGETVGTLALAFTAFNPTVLAHGHLANTDVPVSLGFLFTTYALWKYGREPSLRQAAWVGLALGISLVTKFSAVTLVPVAFVWWLAVSFRNRRFGSSWKELLLVLAILWTVIWAAYFGQSHIELSSEPITNWVMDKVDVQLARLNTDAVSVSRVLGYILPTPFWKGLILIFGSAAYGRPAYLLGQHHLVGIWYYFPLLFLLKTQTAALLLAGWYGLRKLPRIRTPKLSEASQLLLLVTSVYLAVSMLNKLNIGIRHILPILVALSFLLALALVEWHRTYPARWVSALLMLLFIVPVALQFPYLLGFHNAFVQPPLEGFRYFNDSNLEWGNQAKEIKETVQERYPGKQVYATYPWNPYALEYFGVQAKPLDERNPPSDGVIILTGTQRTIPRWDAYRDLVPDYNLHGHTFFYVRP